MGPSSGCGAALTNPSFRRRAKTLTTDWGVAFANHANSFTDRLQTVRPLRIAVWWGASINIFESERAISFENFTTIQHTARITRDKEEK